MKAAVESSGYACVMERRCRLLRVGGEAAADGGGVGVCGAGRAGAEAVRMGRRAYADGAHQCNIWQGVFPDANSADDGYKGTAPVDAYEPNGYGLYNVSGNVWEWTADWFSPTFHVEAGNVEAGSVNGARDNPQGPPAGQSKTIRGGSYLCHDSYCNRYRVAARTSNTPDSSTGNLGFRCVRDA